MNILRFTTGDIGVTVSGLFGVSLAIFGDGVISTTIAVLIVLNLLPGLVVSIRKLLRRGRTAD
jgi:hypothetical protein